MDTISLPAIIIPEQGSIFYDSKWRHSNEWYGLDLDSHTLLYLYEFRGWLEQRRMQAGLPIPYFVGQTPGIAWKSKLKPSEKRL